jgi:murein DD-endopeptidase MepM/ murein hydrolase activator NlpD
MVRKGAAANVLSGLALAVFFWSCQNEVRTAPEAPAPVEGSGYEDPGTVAAPAPFLDQGSVAVGQTPGSPVPPGGFFKTPSSEFVFPVLAGSLGSAWCACRSIGTSPHVGQDMIDGGVGTQKSIAISNGVVKKVTYDASCGWSVTFQDSMGADWRYVHLNQPSVKLGQIVPRGTILGINQDYPKAGCGTGAHLHLERRSPGQWGSAEEFRTCQYGRQTCYFNPNAPLQRARVLATDAQRRTVVAQSPLRSFQSTSTAPSVSLQALSPKIVTSLTSPGVLSVRLALAPEGNPLNICWKPSLKKRPCIEGWRTELVWANGRVVPLTEGRGAGGLPVQVSFETSLMNLSSTGDKPKHLRVVVRNRTGEISVRRYSLDPGP